MSKERDLLDYLNLASNVAQNFQLGSIESRLKQMANTQIEQIIAAKLQVTRAEKQKAIRNAIWTAKQGLEQAKKIKKENPDTHLGFAMALEALTLPLSAEDCDEWEDKERLQLFCHELEALKQEAKAKIGENDYEDLVKAFKAKHCLASLDTYIRLRKCREDHDEAEKRSIAELDALRKRKASLAIAEKESELEALRKKSPFESDSVFGPWFREHKEPSAFWDGEIAMRAYREYMDEINGIVNGVYDELSEKFDSRSYDAAIQYRTELLEATMRFRGFASVKEAENYILRGDKASQSEEVSPQAKKVDTGVTELSQEKQSGETPGETRNKKTGIGKRGWFGVVLCVVGIIRLVSAQVGTDWAQGEQEKDIGKGVFDFIVGLLCVAWGYWKYSRKTAVTPKPPKKSKGTN